MYLENYEGYLGTGENNGAGESLKEFLEGYNPKLYDTPANTVDNLIFTYNETAGGAVLGKVLLIKRGNHPSIGFWALPGGFVEYRENLDDAAARELMEETGLDNVRGVPFATFGAYDRDPRMRIITTAYVFLEKEGVLSASAGDDASDAKWFDFSVVSAGKTDDCTDKVEKEFFDLSFVCGELKLSARVLRVIDRSSFLERREYASVFADKIAGDHGAIIMNGYDYVIGTGLVR